jgi:hypothetical protein
MQKRGHKPIGLLQLPQLRHDQVLHPKDNWDNQTHTNSEDIDTYALPVLLH